MPRLQTLLFVIGKLMAGRSGHGYAAEAAWRNQSWQRPAYEKLTRANEDQHVGIRTLPRSIEEPLCLIVQSAASVAGLLLTTEVIVADAPKEEHDHPPMGGGGMCGMGM